MANKRPAPRRSIGFRRTSISTIIDQSNDIKRRDQSEVRNQEYQHNCQQTVTNFLVQNSYPINSRTLLNPSSKDFKQIFVNITSKIDKLNFDRFEDEAFNLLKCLQYPFINELNRSSLKTITPHMWPVLLSMLSWLVDTVDEINVFDNKKNEIYTKTYIKYLDGEDEKMNKMIEEYKESFVKDYLKDLDILKQKEADLEINIKEAKITNNSSLKTEIKELKDINEDLIRKIQNVPLKIQKLDEEKTNIKQQTEDFKNQIKEIEKHNEKLNKRIENQEMDIKKYTKLKKELENFEEKMENLSKKKNEINLILDEKQTLWENLKEKEEQIIRKIKNLRRISLSFEEKNYEKIFLESENFKDELNENLIKMHDEVKKLIESENERKVELETLKKTNEISNKELTRVATILLEKKKSDELNQAKCLKDLEKMKNKCDGEAHNEKLNILRLKNELEKERINFESRMNEMDRKEEESVKKFEMFFGTITEVFEQIKETENEIKKFLHELKDQE